MSAAKTENLHKIDHIVVVMLENRSFDHMLGYLSVEGGRPDVDGLAAGMANQHAGHTYPVHHLPAGAFATGALGPDHSGAGVARQVNGGKMDGFVAAYAEALAGRGLGGVDPGPVMGYYGAEELPTYDHLAGEFTICDRWHSSVPGATWPNRLYALTGAADGSHDDRPVLPLYDKHSFVRHLDAAGVSWKWYSYAPGTLRCVDGEYLVGRHDHFAFVDRVKLRWPTVIEESVTIDAGSASFLEDAVRGDLAAVSWIDPNFYDLDLVGSPSNDDHPPSDVAEGQELVFRIYNALATGPKWDKTLLVVVYDEHGGFHDHVAPPEAPDDDPEGFGRYGVRVPALIVSPWAAPGAVSHTLFDHTSVIKTIMERFCSDELVHHHGIDALKHWLERGHPHYLGRRVEAATGLGQLLSEPRARPAPDREALGRRLAGTRAELAAAAVRSPPSARAADWPVTDLQLGMAAAAEHFRQHGLPHGQP
ncbi:MAG: phospholipase [Solirubrobacteraceae bacterium]|nr:phospholipase [Solirubrobacteraceae bacterium]